MAPRSWIGAVALGVLVLTGLAPLMVTRTVDAQATATDAIAGYLDRMGLSWKRSDKDANLLIVTKTSSLQRAERVELYIYNDPKNSVIDILAYPKVGGKYLALAGVTDRSGLMRKMLEENEDAFGAYFIDSEGDIGFKFVFTTEAGVGYDAFKTVINELFRIADDPAVKLVNSYR